MKGKIKKLIPCAVPCTCGGLTVLRQSYLGVWSVVCIKCGAGVNGFKSETEAVGAWGREVFAGADT